MITKESVGYTLRVGKKSKQWQEQEEYKKNVKECSLCHNPLDIRGGGHFGELGYIQHHHSSNDPQFHYDYFFMILCDSCFDAVRDTLNKLRKEKDE